MCVCPQKALQCITTQPHVSAGCGCCCVWCAGPQYRPVFGNLPEFRDIGSHEFMQQCYDRYGPVYKIWFGHRPWIIVCDPDLGK